MPAASMSPRKFFTEQPDTYPLPNLIELQLDDYAWFLDEGIRELLDEINPIEDFTQKNLELHFLKHIFDEPKYDEMTSRAKNATFEAALRAQVQLVNKVTGEVKEQEVYLGNLPVMTNRGTFVINGVERVVVSQIVRSPGVIFEVDEATNLAGAKIIPNRGAWLEIETSKKGILTVKIDRKRKLPLTALLRAFGYGTDDQILALFADLVPKNDVTMDVIHLTLEKDPTTNVEEGLQAVYKRIRPGDLATAENAKSLIDTMFFDFRRYDMGRVGRYKVNKRLGVNVANDRDHRIFQVSDLVAATRELIKIMQNNGHADDIDHLANRRVRAVGELVQNKFRVGLLRTERIAKDRMTVLDLETVVPAQLINSRPIIAAMREFFASSQLSQFMDQTNPLSELEHKRRLSAMGPGGLARERASFDVRDVHETHYGRICPIETPEGPNIGLVVHLASYARVNQYGFIETPYRAINHFAPNKAKDTVGRQLEADVLHPRTKKVLAKDHDYIDEKTAKILEAVKEIKEIPVRAYLSDKVTYYDAGDEHELVIAQANTPLDARGNLTETRAEARRRNEAQFVHYKDLTHIDVSPSQVFSVATSLIPFLEHDEGTRALMGSNMQRQAVSLLYPQAPVVGTGMEGIAARNSRQVVTADEDGTISYVDGRQIVLISEGGKKYTYTLQVYNRSNQGTSMHQRPIIATNQKVKKGQALADGAATENGELALGRNLLVAYMSWNGYNYQDAIIVSESLIKNDAFSSVHIEDYIEDVRDTKLGPEMITRDIPNIGEDRLKDLDEDGIVRIGAEVNEGDILVGKITPKGETELTAEERLLRAIFGEKARDVKDTSHRMPGGARGKVVGVKIFTRANGDELPNGVNKQVLVSVAQIKRLSVGDKLAGRHGNKGVISNIVPVEDMPHLEDGTPVDIILNPLGVVSRMNLGQILEAHLGWAAQTLGFKVASPALAGVPNEKIFELLKEAGKPDSGKVKLYSGKTGEPFDEEITVGIAYIMKLNHLVDDKIHARSIGPYSLVTQQPLGGKAQHGGQRFGEMEVWALEAYGVAHTLQEMLTIKSDDVVGRSKAYEAIVKGEDPRKPRTPESFNVLIRELRSLGLHVSLMKDEQHDYGLAEEAVEASVTAFMDPTAPVEIPVAAEALGREEDEFTEKYLEPVKGDAAPKEDADSTPSA